MRKLALPLLPILALAVAGCGSSNSGKSTGNSTSTPAASTTTTSSSSSPKTSTSATAVSTRAIHGLGTVLVNGEGHTLYVFVPDKHAKVTCTGSCAQLWPPLKLASGSKPRASGAARSSLLGSDADPEGGSVVTYAGWPLYTYVGDSGAGSASGQGLDTNGGLWYVLSPAGQEITKTP